MKRFVIICILVHIPIITYGNIINPIEEFIWIGMDADKVGTYDPKSGFPDGTLDGHFRLKLKFIEATEIASIAVYLSNPDGTPVTGIAWHTDLSYRWLLGVFEQGKQINLEHVPYLARYSDLVELDLYANNSGHFVEGQWFLVEVKTARIAKYRKTLQIKSTQNASIKLSSTKCIYPVRPLVIFDYCKRNDLIGNKLHKGTDLFAKAQQPVYAVCDGTADGGAIHNYTGKRYGTKYDSYWNSFLILKHNCGGKIIYAYYGHIVSDLKQEDVSIDNYIKAGEQIGRVMEAYNVAGIRDTENDHLHIGLNDTYVPSGWGYADSGATCDEVGKAGWRDPKVFFGW